MLCDVFVNVRNECIPILLSPDICKLPFIPFVYFCVWKELNILAQYAAE